MKKIISVLLIFTLVFSLTSCGEGANKTDKPQIDSDAISDTDPVYDEASKMIHPIADFIEYNHILNNSINYDSVEAEDFWNIVAITAAAYEDVESIAEIDDVGVYHMDWNIMVDLAKTFLYKSWYKHNVPSYKTSYAASADPGSGVIDLIPLSVDNFDGQLDRIEISTKNSDYDYVAYIDLYTRDASPTVYHYAVYLSYWEHFVRENYGEEDSGEHIMPFVVTGYRYLGSDET